MLVVGSCCLVAMAVAMAVLLSVDRNNVIGACCPLLTPAKSTVLSALLLVILTMLVDHG